MSFSIDCLTPHPPSPSKRLIHSRRFALSERDSRLPHAPAPRGRRQPRTGGAGPGDFITSWRSYPQVVSTGLCMAVGVCGMSPFHLCTTPVRDLHTGRAPLPEAPGPGRHAPWDGIPRYRVLAENPGIPSDQSRSPSRSSRGRAPDSCHSTFLIAMQLEHGHDQVRRARGGPVLSTVLHRREADLWITRQGMIRHPTLRAVRGGCRLRGRQTASSESMAERKTPRPSVPVRGPACEPGPKPGSTACSGWGMSPTTLPRSLRTPAMSRAEPLGLPT